jgi:hypothetical protein
MGTVVRYTPETGFVLDTEYVSPDPVFEYRSIVANSFDNVNIYTSRQSYTLANDWNTIQNKPSTFPPSAHTHPTSDIDGFADAVTDLIEEFAPVYTQGQGISLSSGVFSLKGTQQDTSILFWNQSATAINSAVRLKTDTNRLFIGNNTFLDSLTEDLFISSSNKRSAIRMRYATTSPVFSSQYWMVAGEKFVIGHSLSSMPGEEDGSLALDTAGNLFMPQLEAGLLALDGDGKVINTTITGDMIGSVDWSAIENTPDTISGYGITDAYTITELNDIFVGTTPMGGYNKTAWDLATAHTIDTIDWVPATKSLLFTFVDATTENTPITYVTNTASGAGIDFPIQELNALRNATFGLFNSSSNGLSIAAHGPSYIQVGTYDIPNTLLFSNTTMDANWTYTSSAIRFWNTVSGNNSLNIYGDSIGIGNFSAVANIRSNLHVKGSLSFETFRSLDVSGSLTANDLNVAGTTPTNITYTVPLSSSLNIGVGKVFVARNLSSSAGNIALTLSGAEKFDYSGGATSTTILPNNATAIICIAAGLWSILWTTSGAATANNGLSVNTGVIQLGGNNLLMNTSIPLNGFTFTIDGGGSKTWVYAANSTKFFNNDADAMWSMDLTGYVSNPSFLFNPGSQTVTQGAHWMMRTVGTSTNKAMLLQSSAADLWTILENGAMQINTGSLAIGNFSASNVHFHIKAGTASLGSMKFDSGTLLTTAVNGVFEYNGTDLFFTRSSAIRNTIATVERANTWTSLQIFSTTIPQIPTSTPTLAAEAISKGYFDTFTAALAAFAVTPKTTAYLLTTTDTGNAFSNEGATALVAFTTPATTAGLHYVIICEDADGVDFIVPVGSTLNIGSSVSSTNRKATSTTPGSMLLVFAISATKWYAIAEGTWVLS